jgi:hypothetical protein
MAGGPVSKPRLLRQPGGVEGVSDSRYETPGVVPERRRTLGFELRDEAGPSIWLPLLHLAAITLAHGTLARVALRRFA